MRKLPRLCMKVFCRKGYVHPKGCGVLPIFPCGLVERWCQLTLVKCCWHPVTSEQLILESAHSDFWFSLTFHLSQSFRGIAPDLTPTSPSPPTPRLPIVLLHQDFISIFDQVLLLRHTVAFPADLYKTRKLILPEVLFRLHVCRKYEFFFHSCWLACEGWAREKGIGRTLSLFQTPCALHHLPSLKFAVGQLLSLNPKSELKKIIILWGKFLGGGTTKHTQKPDK